MPSFEMARRACSIDANPLRNSRSLSSWRARAYTRNTGQSSKMVVAMAVSRIVADHARKP